MRSILLLCFALLTSCVLGAGEIDRKEVVTRNNISTDNFREILALGNGEFCFGVDGTGLQNFGGNIMANWAWHSMPLPDGASMADVPETGTIETGKLVDGMKQASARKDVSTWMFRNPHKFSMGRFRFADDMGNAIDSSEISDLVRKLDLWTGVHSSYFKLKGSPVRVTTLVHPVVGMVTTRIESELLEDGGLAVILDFPYPIEGVGNKLQDPWYGRWDADDRHTSLMARTESGVEISRLMDSTFYRVNWSWNDNQAELRDYLDEHKLLLIPSRETGIIEFTCSFSEEGIEFNPGFDDIKSVCSDMWENYWMEGGVIDFSGSKDPRWKEIERRVVLSQYLMRSNSAGSWPPSEVALMGIDFWSSQFHMEMIWWHLAHYALWDRWELAEDALGCYEKFLPMAKNLAAQFGYQGAKWGKQVGPEGRTAPWIHSFLLHWQQPHPIFFAELGYRLRPGIKTLQKWETVIMETAEYMADFPVKQDDGFYHLNPVCTANENDAGDNPAFENAYWRWALAKAQEWRERLGYQRNEKWDLVLKNMAPLPQLDGVYLFCDGWTDTYTRLNEGHPDPLGVCAFLPFVEGIDPEIARSTVEKIFNGWKWEKTWGWDFPWSAMAAARTGRPDLAIEILLNDAGKNSYALNGINEGWYFPGNGGLLYAVAMMAAGWDGSPDRNAPGFPDKGQWSVKWEGLNKAL